ncbi:hypothetical protein FORC44_p293 (plasmid) [Escherichia coli]|nr:hypothetical protein FORC44_p293 [Escherichia coli]
MSSVTILGVAKISFLLLVESAVNSIAQFPDKTPLQFR